MRRSFRLAVASGLLFVACLLPCGLHPQTMFRRGDVDDSGGVNLTDAVRLLSVLFDITRDFPCYDAADADDSGRVQLTDAVYLLSFLFQQGSPPPSPFPTCGADPTPDELVCGRRGRCWREPVDDLIDPLFEPLGEHEAFVFVVDRSLSMNDSGELDFARSETIRRVRSLPEEHEFTVMFFDRAILQYPDDGHPVRATPAAKSAAADWIAKVPGGSGTCPEAALSTALTALDQSPAGRRIIYLGDGGATCNGANEELAMARTLETVAAQNTEGIVIHVVSIETFGTVHGGFLRALADAHEGLFVEIDL